MAECKHSEDCCQHQPAVTSVVQTIDEMDFERGIWNAALMGNIHKIENMIAKDGIDPNLTDNYGYTALHYAARHKRLEVCRLLLHNRANTNIQSRVGGVTALHRAAYTGDKDIVIILLENRANQMLADSDGQLPSHKACQGNHIEIMKILYRHTPEAFDKLDDTGKSPMDYLTDSNAVIELKELMKCDK
ncbi:Ankyrin repeat domain-containing protein 39-like [Oopsacas minuta]|uniref:Ankyrin repeat domain-containing protein 39-like n=1 Tax=Oopsacas minuta TaxID=111878 RepID=A0AAV7JY17_9METZ|nr:Ankyrin repeat domain-containing protein 39-like [Oopsacas minuta]